MIKGCTKCVSFHRCQFLGMLASLTAAGAMFFKLRSLNWASVALMICAFAHSSTSTDLRQLVMTLVFISTGLFGPYAIFIQQYLKERKAAAGDTLSE